MIIYKRKKVKVKVFWGDVEKLSVLGGARGRLGHECSTAWPIKEGVSPQLPHSTAMLCATDVVN